MRPIADSGVLDDKGVAEVVSCLKTDGTPIPYDIRKSVWVCIEADTDYIKRCLEEYSVVTNPSGRGNLPLGLAHNLVLKHDVPQDCSLTWDDVTFDASVKAYQLRKETEQSLS